MPQVQDRAQRASKFLGAAKGLAQYRGWSDQEIERNISEVFQSNDGKRVSSLVGAMGGLKEYTGWKPDEIQQNVVEIFSSAPAAPVIAPSATHLATPQQPTALEADQQEAVARLTTEADFTEDEASGYLRSNQGQPVPTLVADALKNYQDRQSGKMSRNIRDSRSILEVLAGAMPEPVTAPASSTGVDTSRQTEEAIRKAELAKLPIDAFAPPPTSLVQGDTTRTSPERITGEESAQAGAIATRILQGDSPETAEHFVAGRETPIARMGRSFATGVIGIPQGIARAPEGIGLGSESLEAGLSSGARAAGLPAGLGSIPKAVTEALKGPADTMQKWVEAVAVENPSFAEQLSSGAGSQLGFWIPGIGLMKGAQLFARFSPKAAAWAGTGLSTILESGVEAANVYDQAIRSGKPTEEAETAAQQTFGVNVLLVGITNKLGIFGEGKTALANVLRTAPIESIQEIGQQITSNIALGEDPYEGVLESGLIGAILGGVGGAVLGGVQKPPPKAPPKPPTRAIIPEVPPPTVTPLETPIPAIEEPSPTEPASTEPQAPPKTVSASPQGEVLVNRAEKEFQTALSSKQRFPLSEYLTKEASELVSPSPSLQKRFEKLVADAIRHNASISTEETGTAVPPSTTPAPKAPEGKPAGAKGVPVILGKEGKKQRKPSEDALIAKGYDRTEVEAMNDETLLQTAEREKATVIAPPDEAPDSEGRGQATKEQIRINQERQRLTEGTDWKAAGIANPRKLSMTELKQAAEKFPKKPGVSVDALKKQLVDIATTGEGTSAEGILRARELAEQSKDLFTTEQRNEITTFLADLQQQLKERKPDKPAALTQEGIAEQQAELTRLKKRTGKTIEELYPKPPAETGSGSVEKAQEDIARARELQKQAPKGKPTGVKGGHLAIPEFKTADEARIFGQQNASKAKEIEPLLIARREEATAAFQKAKEANDNTGVQKAAIQDQMASEALQYLRNPKLETPIEEFKRKETAETPEIPPELEGKIRFQGANTDKGGKSTLYEFIIEEEGKAKKANFSVRPGESVADAYEKTKAKFEAGKPKTEDTPKSSTQLNIPKETAKPFVEFAESIPEQEIYDTPEKDYGREKEPHITALFGLTDVTPDQVQKVVKDFGEVEIELGKTSIFENPEYDVLKVDVKGERLHELNKLLREKLPYESDHPDYKPHLTIAYLKKGEGGKYAGDDRFEGQKLKLTDFVFSDPQYKKTPVALAKPEAPKPPAETVEKKEPAPVETDKPATETPAETQPSRLQVSDVPLSEIETDVDAFQNRETEFSEESVKKITGAINEGKFSINEFDPILLWQDPDNNQLFVLSGHSRAEAFRQASKAGKEEFSSIPAKIIKGVSKKEAQEIAKRSNVLGTRETPIERANYYRRLRDQGKSEKEAIEEARKFEGKNAGQVIGLSYLNPKGKAVDALRALEGANVSTVIHESAHIFRRDLYRAAGEAKPEFKAQIEADIKTMEEWAGVKNGNWGVGHEERFARAFERYVREGKAPTAKLEPIFQRFKEWLTEVYRSIKGSAIDVKITPDVRKVFDRLLAQNPQTRLSPEEMKAIADKAERPGSSIPDKLSKTEESLATAIDTVIPEAKIPLGLSIRHVATPPKDPKPDTAFPAEIEERFKNAHGVPKEGFFVGLRGALETAKNRITREFEYLPRTAEFAQIRFALNKLQKQKNVSADRVVRAMQGITIELNQDTYPLFERKVILDDLAREADAERLLPFGFTPESLAAAKAKIDAEVEKFPAVKKAVEKRRDFMIAVRSEYIKAMDDAGFDVSEKMRNDDYYRHQVLMYANAKGTVGAGRKLRTPTGRGFLKKRQGSSYDINSNYIEAEYSVLSQMLHDAEVAKTIKLVKDEYDIYKSVKEIADRDNIEIEGAIPEGYVEWRPREGNLLYFADSIPAQLAQKVQEGLLHSLGVTAEEIKKVLVFGPKRKPLIIKAEIAKTLDNLKTTRDESILGNIDRRALGAWKEWQLISPRRFFKYNFRNVTGDADAVFVGNPSTFTKVPQATKDLYQAMIGSRGMTSELREWFKRGGFDTTLQAAELWELNKFEVFEHIRSAKKSIADIPGNIFKAYWRNARLATNTRESILRYAAYLDYLSQIQANGKPKNYGASIREEIDGIKSPRDKAFQLANDLLGAYDQVSVFGQWLRRYVFPFWSWKEVNMKRYFRFLKNAVQDEQAMQFVGRKALGLAAKSPVIAYRTGKFLIKATAFWSVLQMWNLLMFPDEEDKLDDDTRSGPHIIFGSDDEGKPIVFTRLGALGDILEWFGLDEFPNEISLWMKDKKTLKEIVIDMAKSPINVVVQGLSPVFKTPAEIATGKKLFPDVFRPTTIRDTGLYLSESIGLANEYKALMGLPARAYNESMKDFFVYTVDPAQSAYHDVYEIKNRYLKKIGKESYGSFISPKSNALYNYRLALRYEDEDAAEKFLIQYFELGGTTKGLAASLGSLNPLSGLNAKEQKEFVASLDEREKERVVKAINYYQNVLLNTGSATEDRKLKAMEERAVRKALQKARKVSRLIEKK